MSTIQKRSNSVVNNTTSKYYLNSSKLPLVIESRQSELKLDHWLRENLDEIQKELKDHGAVLFRNFSVRQLNEFENVVKSYGRSLMDYDYASTPRTLKQGKVYTSTEYPAEKVIAQHNEMSYSRFFPKYLWFYCELPSEVGGETPLADSRKLYANLSQDVKGFFADNRLLYVRNYHPNMDLDWRAVFNTDQPSHVEQFCSERGIDFRWYTPNQLQTKEVSQVIIELEDGISWFNQAHLFHVTNLEPTIASQLLKIYGEEFLPRNVYRGDGSKIPEHYLSQIRERFDQGLVQFPWMLNDVLLVDNLRVSHGRNSFSGPRKIAVAMTQ